MGHAKPVRSRKAPVKFANKSSVCDFDARTASTANSGRVCIHARIASAKPCATKNCADSAPHVINNEAPRIAGVVQRAAFGLDWCSGTANNNNAKPNTSGWRWSGELDKL